MKTIPFAIAASLLLAPAAMAADPMAVAILRPATGIPAPCALVAEEPQVVELYRPSIGGKSSVRLSRTFHDTIDGAVFGQMDAVGFKDLAQLEMSRDGRLMASYAPAKKDARIQPSIYQWTSIPDKKPASTVPITRLYDTTLDGEQRQPGRTAEKRSIPLKQIWKVFFIPEGSIPDVSLFAHAQAERSIAQWTFYLKVSFYRVPEARSQLILVAEDCVDRALRDFRAGDFSASVRAFELVELNRRLNTASTAARTAERRVAEIDKAVQDVRAVIDKGDLLFRERKWDDALAAWAPIAAFSTDPALPEFANSYLRARRESHDLHVRAASDLMAADRAAGRFSLDDAVLREALTHCETAVSRMPPSAEGQACQAEAAIRITASKAKRLRAAGELRHAAEILIFMNGSPRPNSDLERTLGEFKRELSRDLYNDAAALVGSAPASDAENAKKTALNAAFQNLQQAESLSSAPEAGKLLQHVNEALANAHVSHANKALGNRQSYLALLHAQAAGRFQPENPGRESVLVQSRAAVEARRQIHFAVAFSDADPRKACSKFNKEFAKTAESAVAGLPDVRMIAPKEAALILAANGAGAMDAKNGTYVFISGKIRCAAPWKDVPRGDHSEGTIEFRPRIAFEIETQDSLSRVSRSVTGAAETFASCFTRIVFSAPTLSPRSIGDPDEVIDSETIPDSSAQGCSINKGKELKELAGRVNTQIRANVIEAFDAVAAHYLDKARASTDPAAAADNYAAFVLMSRDKQSPAYREAVTAIHSYDPDLQPEAIARQGR